MFVGLVQTPRWPPEEPGDSGGGRSWKLPRTVLFWIVAVLVARGLDNVIEHRLGELASYLFILVALTAAAVRIDRSLSHLYWRGLRDHQS